MGNPSETRPPETGNVSLATGLDDAVKIASPAFIVPALVAGLVYFGFALGAIYFGRLPGSIATLWYANAVGTIALLYVGKRRWPAMLFVLAVANLTANTAFGDPVSVSLSFLPGNLGEILLAAWLLDRTKSISEATVSPIGFAQALFWGAAVPAAFGATIGSIVLSPHVTAALPNLWLTWFEGDLIGTVSILPLGLFWLGSGGRRLREALFNFEAPPMVALAVAVGVFALVELPFPFVYIALPQVLLAIRFGFAVVAGAALLVSVALGLLISLGIFLPPPTTVLWGHLLFYLPILATLIPPLILAASVEGGRRDRRLLAAAEKRFRELYSKSPAMMYSSDAVTARITSVSELWLEKMGYEEHEVIGHRSVEFMTPLAATHALDVITPMFERDGSCRNVELQMVTKSGEILDVWVSATVDRDAAGQPVRRLVALTDVTEEKRLARALAEEQELFEVTLHSIGDGVVSTDLDGCVTYLNPVAEDMLGWTRTEASGRRFDEVVRLFDQTSGEALENPVQRCLKEASIAGIPANAVLRDRTDVDHPIQDSVSPIRGTDGEMLGAVMVFQDVAESRALAQRMAHLAQHDALTNLPNRVLLLDRLEQACRSGLRTGQSFGIAFIDLDHFKHVNDSLGHAAGDDLLRTVAKRLTASVRASDTVCRIGGDEFVVLFDKLTSTGDTVHVAEKILSQLARTCRVAETDVVVAASMGIAVFPDDGEDGETLMKHADAAMYRAKREGRNRFHLFSHSMDEAALHRLSLETDMRRGLVDGDFHVAFQPIFDSATRRMQSVEALARWNRPGEGLQPPSVFIPVAEESGLIIPLNAWVLEQSCRQMRQWLDSGAEIERVTVNISAVHFNSPAFVHSVVAILERTALDARHLELEITETMLLKQPEITQSVLADLRVLGVRVAIDDFGTGFSALNYLRRFAVDTLKVDQSFVRDIADDERDRKIVEAIIGLGRTLGLRTVAEGVESERQADLLVSMGCDAMQGFFFARPCDAEEMTAILLRKKVA